MRKFRRATWCVGLLLACSAGAIADEPPAPQDPPRQPPPEAPPAQPEPLPPEGPPEPPPQPPPLINPPRGQVLNVEQVLKGAGALSDREILASIHRGGAFLLSTLPEQIEKYKKPAVARRPGVVVMPMMNDHLAGEIVMSVYALLMIEKVTGDPRYRFTAKEMEGPVKFVTELRTHHTYTLGLQASALSLLPNRPEYRRALTAVRDDLLKGCIQGTHTYQTQQPTPVQQGGIQRMQQMQPQKPQLGDNSNSQYGQLGMWACGDAGLEIPLSYWEMVDRHWRSTQAATGGWAYTANMYRYAKTPPGYDGSTQTMTAAGVASLFLAQDQLDRSVNLFPRTDKALDAGVAWLTNKYTEIRSQLAYNLYLAYGVERVALSGGIRTFGKNDWYRDGATLLLATQQPDGSWANGYGTGVSTAYALLFLSRGIAPVACGKLQYDGPWNARGRDCARLVHWLSKNTEKALNWQTVSLDSDVAEWQNIPVLVLTGSSDPKFTPEQIAKLRRYVNGGGLIFSSTDDGRSAFTTAIRQKYAPALFDNAYEMRALPADHAAFQLNYQVVKSKQPKLFGLSNGVREVWIHSLEDVTGSWQAYATAKWQQHFEVTSNIYSYTQGRTVREVRYEPLTPPKPPASTVTLNVARINYSGNWDPEPTAWEKFAEEARYSWSATIRAVPTKIADLDPAKTPLAHMTGTTAFTLTEAEKAKLVEFVNKGGSILADATGGGTRRSRRASTN